VIDWFLKPTDEIFDYNNLFKGYNKDVMDNDYTILLIGGTG